MKLKKKIKSILKKSGLFKSKAKTQYIESSSNYWDQRYLKNKDSGAGSYGRLADFKAEVLNEFVEANAIQSVIELGSGDGNQLKLANYKSYIGFDVSEEAIRMCKEMFQDDPTKQFFLMDDPDQLDATADLSLSLDVIYHLIEDDVFEGYMNRLFDSSNKFVIIYSSNHEGYLARHVRSREFTTWVDNQVSGQWQLKEMIKNRYPFDKTDPDNTSISDFYIYEKINSNQD